MEQLWAPWRMEYINALEKDEGCFFCNAVKDAPENDKKHFLLYRGEHVFCMFNKFPYNNGHLLVSPVKHTGELIDLDDDTLLELMKMTNLMQQVINRAMNPDGFNIGVNIGRPAGAGIVDHVHLHVVPRWSGDTNFMTVTAGTKVIPQSLDGLYDLLKQELETILHEG